MKNALRHSFLTKIFVNFFVNYRQFSTMMKKIDEN